MKQKYSVLTATGILLVLFSLIVFIAPIPKTGVFWLSYVFAVIALAAQLGFVYVAFAEGTSARSRFYGFPIFRIGVIYLIVQMVLSLAFMLLGKWVPLWIPGLAYLVVLALAAIGLIAADNVRDAVYVVEEKQADNTVFMRSLRRSAEVLAQRYPELSDLAEDLRYADRYPPGASESYERQMHAMLEELEQCPTRGLVSRLKNQLLELLSQRNAVCKSSKTR